MNLKDLNVGGENETTLGSTSNMGIWNIRMAACKNSDRR